jgi:hypothetical protein
MVWSNWQGASWRGAMLVLLFWSGLAWTQTPAPIPLTDPAERIMVVHENGKSTRCRVMEAWQLPDGRVAHLLQAIETAEMITIVDEPGHHPGAIKNSQAMPKRIFSWGMGRRTPPEGSPMPPHLRFDSGIVIKNESPAPIDAVPTQDTVVVNRLVDEKVLGAPSLIRDEGPNTVVQKSPPVNTRPTRFNRFPKRQVVSEKPADPQVVVYGNATPIVQGTAPMIIYEAPTPPVVNPQAAHADGGQRSIKIDVVAPSQPTERIVSMVHANGGQGSSKIDVVPPLQPTERIVPMMTPTSTYPPIVNPNVGPSFSPANETAPIPSGLLKKFDPNKQELCQPAEPVAKKRWYPGANLQAWLQNRSAPSMPKTEIVKTEAPKTEAPKTEAPKTEAPKTDVPKTEAAKTEAAKADEAKKLQKAQDFLALQNKVADKQLTDKIEKMYGTPFSTARMPVPNAPQPEMKKPDPSPLAIAKPTSTDTKPPIQAPAPKGDTVKPTDLTGLEKRDMWGSGPLAPVLPPGKSLLDQAVQPPTARPKDPLLAPEKLVPNDDRLKPKVAVPALMAPNTANDPLLAPEKLVPNDDRLKPKVAMPAPMAPNATETDVGYIPSDVRSNPYPARPVNWPLGTQSVQAANSGLLGNPMYIPVPTVTVPQPHNPPVPPAPKLPEAPNLNAYVNAFTPPPPPKAAPQQQPMQGMMAPQASAPYGNPMMTQQMMPQQQIMTQQQMMMLYGYRPNPAMMYPYTPQQPMMAQGMLSQGPMANFSRQYVGPQAPNPFAANPAVQTGYAPAPYPPMVPMHAMMPQQPTMQPVAYQQQPVPSQQQTITQQVEQLIKVMRESPYPAQREWAAQSLTSFEWRAHPQIVPALLQSASHDPAASVRAGCVYCLGRMQAAVEPVFGTLYAMRNDIDPRVRAEVEQAVTRLGRTPMNPQ